MILSYTTGSFFMDIYGTSADTILLISYIDEEVERYHYGRDDIYNCPPSIRPVINQLRKLR